MSTVLTVNTQTLHSAGSGRHTIDGDSFYGRKKPNEQFETQTLRRAATHYELKPTRGLDIMA